MKRLSSRDNAVFRSLRRLATDNGAARAAGLALLEGVHLCDAYLRSGGVPRQVVVGRSSQEHHEVVAIVGRTASEGADGIVLEDALFDALSRLAGGVALLMVVEVPKPSMPDRLERTSVLLDRVQDPGNVGSILRSAAAAGIGDVYLSDGCASGWSSKALRAGMGAHFHLRLYEEVDLVALRERADVAWTATGPHAARSIHEADLRGDVAWLFGHEGQGLAVELTAGATSLRIPQPGRGESLNVAAAAAVCFFEQVRQRDRRG